MTRSALPWRRLIALLLAGLLLHQCAVPVQAKHFEVLPGLPTPVIKRVWEQGKVTYAFDQNTAAYPGFRAQAAEGASAGYAAIGLIAEEAMSGPDIWLTMPDDAAFTAICGQGAAACIQYWADPIMIFFRRALLYTNWRTTIAHEGINYGHAMGQHEQYFDDGEFRCDPFAFYTVMSCGTGVWQP